MTQKTQEPATIHLSNDVWVSPPTGAIFAFSNTTQNTGNRSIGNDGQIANVPVDGKPAYIWEWGEKNNLPTEREALIMQNNIVPTLLQTKRDITIGQGLYCYREEFRDGKRVQIPQEIPSEAKTFFKKINLKRYLRTACKNLIVHANTFTEFRKGLGGKIVGMEALESRHVRAGAQDDEGWIREYFWCGNWRNPNSQSRAGQKFVVQRIPAFHPGRSERMPDKFLLHCCDDLLTDDYYAIPTWAGGSTWIEVANAIPVFHKANLKNGYLIRYHIEIPRDYFTDYQLSAAATNDVLKQKVKDAEEAKKAEFTKKVNELLAGEQNAGRALFSFYEINRQLGKDFPGIKITPIQVDLKDEALLKLFERSNDANISAQGVHPTLAAIQTQGKLASGSEIRNAFLMYVATKTPVPRDILLEPIELVHEVNGWGEGLKWGFLDIEITKLDENPAGAQEVAMPK